LADQSDSVSKVSIWTLRRTRTTIQVEVGQTSDALRCRHAGGTIVSAFLNSFIRSLEVSQQRDTSLSYVGEPSQIYCSVASCAATLDIAVVTVTWTFLAVVCEIVGQKAFRTTRNAAIVGHKAPIFAACAKSTGLAGCTWLRAPSTNLSHVLVVASKWNTSK